jgi:hypothetical protein
MYSLITIFSCMSDRAWVFTSLNCYHDGRYLVPGVASMDGGDGERFPRFHGMQVERLSRQLSARCVSVASAVVGDCSHVLEASCVMVVAIGKGNMPLAPTELCSRVVELFGKARKNALEVTTWGDE